MQSQDDVGNAAFADNARNGIGWTQVVAQQFLLTGIRCRRRLDGHFYGLCKLGAVMSGEETYRFDAPAGLSGRELFLDEASVTATEQILIAAAAARHAALSPRMILFLKTGICGGFTTFSTFALETSGLLQAGRLPAAAAYVVLSVLLSVGAVVLVQALAG